MKKRPECLTDEVWASMGEAKKKKDELDAKIEDMLAGDNEVAWLWLEGVLKKLKAENCEIVGIEVDKVASDFKLNLVIRHGVLSMDFRGDPSRQG